MTIPVRREYSLGWYEGGESGSSGASVGECMDHGWNSRLAHDWLRWPCRDAFYRRADAHFRGDPAVSPQSFSG
jgi:hypothetical protein